MLLLRSECRPVERVYRQRGPLVNPSRYEMIGTGQRPVLLESASRAIAGSRTHPVLVTGVRRNLDRDLAEPFVRIRLRIVGDGVAVAQILADVFESFHLLLPRLREVGFATRAVREIGRASCRE